MKLELAIIENLQREDLNALDRAKAFKQLVEEFGLKHGEVGARVGKSREYVSNTLRILLLPQYIQDALADGQISEGHTRPLLMLADNPQAQEVLLKEVIARRLSVRDTESLARRSATDKVRHKALMSPDLLSLEKQLSERLGTRVRIEKKDTGGKVTIDFFSPEDLTQLCLSLTKPESAPSQTAPTVPAVAAMGTSESSALPEPQPEPMPEIVPKEEPQDPELYSINNFSL